MMKKILSVLLTTALLLGMMLPVSGAEQPVEAVLEEIVEIAEETAAENEEALPEMTAAPLSDLPQAEETMLPTEETTEEETPEPDSEVTAETETEVTAEPEAEVTIEPETEETAEPDSEVTAEPETEAIAEPETEVTTEPETESTTEPETDATTEPEAGATTEPETESTTEPEADATTEPEAEATVEPETDATTEPETEVIVEPEAEATAEPETDPSAPVIEAPVDMLAPAEELPQPSLAPVSDTEDTDVCLDDMPDIGPWELPGIEVTPDLGDGTDMEQMTAPINHIYSVRDLRTATEVGRESVTLYWQPGETPYREYVDGSILYADQVEFHVFRATEEYGNYTYIATTTENSYLDEGVTFGHRYYYMVCTQVKIDELYFYDDPVKGEDTVSATVLDTVGRVQIDRVHSIDTNAVRLRWQAVPNVTGYQLFRSTSPDDGFAWIKNVSGCVTGNYSLTGGTMYYYRIRAYRDVRLGDETIRCYGEFSRTARVQVLGKAVVNTARNYGTNAAILRWPRVEGATAYQLFRKEAGVGEFTWVKNCTTTQVVNYALTPGKTYWYVVRAIVDQPEGRAYGNFSDGVFVTIPSVLRLSGEFAQRPGYVAADLSWTQINNMTGYQVFMAKGTPDDYQWIRNVTNCYDMIRYLKKGEKVWIKVRPYIEYEDGERAYGAFSNRFVGTP